MHTILPDNFCGGLVSWRLVILSYVARALGLMVHVEGFPYGSRRNIDFSGRTESCGACDGPNPIEI